MGYTQCCPNVLESFFEDTKLSIFEISHLHLVDHMVKTLEHPRVITLEQRLISYVAQIKSDLLLAIINKILSEYSHVQLFQNYLCLLPCYISAS